MLAARLFSPNRANPSIRPLNVQSADLRDQLPPLRCFDCLSSRVASTTFRKRLSGSRLVQGKRRQERRHATAEAAGLRPAEVYRYEGPGNRDPRRGIRG